MIIVTIHSTITGAKTIRSVTPSQAWKLLEMLAPERHPSYEEFVKRWTVKEK